MVITDLKLRQLEDVARHRDALRKDPHLVWLFFEITNRCNLKCKHCGSSCTARGEELTVADVERALRSVNSSETMICLTGGEPMLHPSFFKIAERVNELGFSWGMTTNGTLIDEEAAFRLKRCGLSTVSVSLDGLEASHDALRQKRGAYRLALRGLEALKKAGFKPQVTTVFHRENIGELEETYSLLSEIGITDWRPINVEPIGRACETDGFALRPEEFAHLIAFIEEKRFDPECKMNVTFGCSHYLGVSDERMARDHYFLCAAGILTASVRSNGDICACLDVENRPELVQGNVRKDDFSEVWKRGFAAFRKDRTESSDKCLDCKERFICGGDSAHTWDFDNNTPLLCYLDYAAALADIAKSEK